MIANLDLCLRHLRQCAEYKKFPIKYKLRDLKCVCIFYTYSYETVPLPHAAPSLRALRNLYSLTVNGHDLSWSFANDASANIWPYGIARHWCHGNSHAFSGGQPVRIIIAGRDVTFVIQIARHKRHGTEFSETTTRQSLRAEMKLRSSPIFIQQLVV